MLNNVCGILCQQHKINHKKGCLNFIIDVLKEFIWILSHSNITFNIEKNTSQLIALQPECIKASIFSQSNDQNALNSHQTMLSYANHFRFFPHQTFLF